MNVENDEFQRSAFHQEVFGNLTFFSQQADQRRDYEDKLFISSILSHPEPDPRDKKKTQRVQTLECLALLRTNADICLDYKTANELKRIRFAYITHLLDWLTHER